MKTQLKQKLFICLFSCLMFGLLWLPLTMNQGSKNFIVFDKSYQVQSDSTSTHGTFYEEEEDQDKRLSISSFNILFQLFYQFSVRDFLKN